MLILEIDIGELLAVVVADDEPGFQFLDGPGAVGSGERAQGRAHLAVYVRRSPRASATLSVMGRLPDKIALTRVRSMLWRRAKAV